VAALQDYRTAKIRNALIGAGMLIAVILFGMSLREKTTVSEIIFLILEQLGTFIILFIIYLLFIK